MKKIKILWAAMCISFFYQGYTQNEPEKPVFEAVMFQDGSKIYVQRGLPIYLSVSTTKDGKGINLETPANPQDANPMFLDTEGVNYLRSKWAIDRRSRLTMIQKERYFFLFMQTELPQTKIFFKGSLNILKAKIPIMVRILSSFCRLRNLFLACQNHFFQRTGNMLNLVRKNQV